MRRICLSILIILCVVSKAYTEDVQQSNDLVRNPSNQTSEHPEEQEVSPQVGDSFSAEDVPSTKETELGRRQPSGKDPLSENQNSKIPRRVRKSAEPSVSTDRIRWLLLVSPLMIVLLSLLTCALGKKALWKPIEDTQKIVLLPSSNPELISIVVQPGYGGEVHRGGEGRGNTKTSSRGAKPGGDHDSYSGKDNSLGTVPKALRNISTTVEDMQQVTRTSLRTSGNVSPSAEGRGHRKTSSRGTNPGGHHDSYSEGKGHRKTSSGGPKPGGGHDSYSEKHGKKFQDAGTRPTGRNTIYSVTQSYSNMDGGNCRRTISLGGDTAIGSWSERKGEKFQDWRIHSVGKHTSSVNRPYTYTDGGSFGCTVSTGGDPDNGSYLGNKSTTENRKKTSSKGKDRVKQEKTSSGGEGQAKREKTSSEGEGQEEQVKLSSEGEDQVKREIPSPEGKIQAKRERTSSESENQVKREKISSEVEVQAKQTTSLEELLQRTFLQKLMALDISARNTVEDNEETLLDSEEEECGDMMSSESLNPLDVLCGLLHQSDMILKQQIVSKMSMCQFAVPLLLPSPHTQDCTFILWSMRDIVKKWRPHSMTNSKTYVEDSIVNVPMPMFSFVRLGTCSISKSQYLNQVLSPSQQNHNFFVHGDMPGGNIPRKHSDGLVEIIWYLPAGHEQLDVFPEPIAVMNLRGDLESNEKQLNFLTHVSSALFIFIEEVCENQHNLLLRLQNVTNVFLILNVRDREDNMKNLKTLIDVLQLPRQNILVKSKHINDSQMVKKIRSAMKMIFTEIKEMFNLEQIAKKATGFSVDENSSECKETKAKAKEITDEINNVNHYKHETMKLQGDLWKEISKMEKEMCRMRKLGDGDAEEYKSELQAKILTLQMVQRKHHLTGGMLRFQEALMLTERTLFLKWLKILLDTIGKNHLRELHNEYKFKYQRRSTTEQDLQIIDQKIVDGSLGVEHFIRELGQYYEAKCSMIKQGLFNEDRIQFAGLPGIASDLLLDGFPLELIDGDASNIPLQWITDVLTELDKKTGGNCRMRVITVLGVQSTGKSTLLNTMFGLQFPVASGRCTRGAFMTLIKVKENFQEELGCDFIMVIDTEGLKAPELASLVDSYEHDNELATLVVGLSDITIINISMENSSEMKDILQIVVHAFLRMSKIGKKPNCHFVHQNVSDVSAHAMGIRDRRRLLEHLNQMTKAAAKMEKLEGITTFNDIMDYDLNEHTWYISGLWYGIPPMAPINTGYSEGVLSLKKYLLDFLKRKLQMPQTIPDFIEWLKSLWNAVKHEKFIFSFRNSLIADAYDKLSVKYSQLEWNFRKEIYNWMTEVLISIKNEPTENLTMETLIDIKQSTSEILSKEEKKMYQLMDTYFDSELENAHLVEKYREDFLKSIRSLRNGLDEEIFNKCREAIDIQKSKRKIEGLKDSYISKIEDKVTSLLSSCRDRTQNLSNEDLEAEFNSIWDETIKGLRVKPIAKQDIDQIMLQQLRKEMSHKSSAINETMLNIKSLLEFADASFEVRDEHIDLKWYKKCQDKFLHQIAGLKEFHKEEYSFKSKQIAEYLLEKSLAYVDQHLKMNENYHDTFCLELLKMVNERLQQRDAKNLHTTDHFEMDLKLLILGKAAPKLQKMHENFVNLNDPYLSLEALKNEYLSIFKAVFQEKDECKARANRFCELCLKPAIVQYVNHHLGQEIVSDVMNGADNMKYMSRTFFQLRVLCKLLEDHSFEQYVKYINNYERFVKESILDFIQEKYEDPNGLQPLRSNIIVPIFQKLRVILQNPQVQESADVSGFLRNVCKMLHKDLVISQEDLKVITFQNSVPGTQFAADVQAFLSDLEEDIMSEMRRTTIETVLAVVILKPEEELFKKVIGCGKQCPFCKVPCEAGCVEHTEHFATVHRPQGLGRYRNVETKVLCSSLCSTDVVTEKSFSNSDTDWKFHPYKDYREFYPDWMIKPDPSINASDYWKFIFKEFNAQFAKEYNAKPARLPKDWNNISKDQAFESLKESFHVK